MSWALAVAIVLGAGAVTPEEVFPAKLDGGVEKAAWAKTEAKASGPVAASAKTVYAPTNEVDTWTKFYPYLMTQLVPTSAWLNSPLQRILGGGWTSGATLGGAAWHQVIIPDRVWWVCQADGTVVFEFLSLNWANQYVSGNATTVDTTQAYLGRDENSNETGVVASEYGKRYRFLTWVRYSRTAAGVEKWETWQVWRIRSHISGAAGAFEEWTDKVPRHQDDPGGSVATGMSVNVNSGSVTIYPAYQTVISNPSAYAVSGGYETMAVKQEYKAFYGSSTTLAGVDKDVWNYTKTRFSERLQWFYSQYGSGKDYYWEHIPDARLSQIHWWGHAGALGYSGGTLPTDFMGDIMTAVKAGFGNDATINIPWGVMQQYKSMTTGERAYYLANLSKTDWDGDGWTNAFERKHGYSFEDFFDKPGDNDGDGYLDTLDVDIDGDGQPNSTDTDDDGDLISDVQEISDGTAPYKWLDTQRRRRPMWHDRVTTAGRISTTVQESNERARGVYVYDDWLTLCFDETAPNTFRWDDTPPGANFGPITTWEPSLEPYHTAFHDERDPSMGYSQGNTYTVSPEALNVRDVPYRAELEDFHYENWGPGWQYKPGAEETYEGWGEDEGDWYAPPHKLGQTEGTGLGEVYDLPGTTYVEPGTERASEVEGHFLGLLESIGLEEIITAVQPGEGQYLDYGGFVTFNVPGVGPVHLQASILPIPGTPTGDALETMRVAYIRPIAGVLFTINFMIEVVALFIPLGGRSQGKA